MAILWSLVIVVSLLVASAPQRCSGVDQGSLALRDAKLLAAMQAVNEALKCMSDAIKEGFRLHEKNSAEMALMVKEQMIMQIDNTDAVKRQLTALHREEALSQENAELKKQLEIRDKKVQVLEKRIIEYQNNEEQLKQTLMPLNNPAAAQKNDSGGAAENQPNRHEIMRLVQQYSHTKDWKILRMGLENVLDRSSEPYIQLQRIYYRNRYPLYYVLYYVSTELASLLLDAGLPADTADAGGSTMLHGASSGGHLRLVKLLLDRGASVDARDGNAWTPLMRAAHMGRLEVVQHLVSVGADTTAKDEHSLTALDHARVNVNPAVVQYLQNLPH